MVQPSTGPEAGTYSKRTPLFDLHREFGPDVAHLNLHKTFCIPHGGGLAATLASGRSMSANT